jgi:hypothetical protein
MKFPADENGVVDISGGVPDGFVHVAKVAAARACASIGVRCAKALVSMDACGGGETPHYFGVVVHSCDAPRVEEWFLGVASTRNPTKKPEKAAKNLSAKIMMAFPGMPRPEVEGCARMAVTFNPDSFGRPSMEGDPIVRAVEAHVRHTKTAYSKLLRDGVPRCDAQRMVYPAVCRIVESWK